jgi:hypothetical protein
MDGALGAGGLLVLIATVLRLPKRAPMQTVGGELLEILTW